MKIMRIAVIAMHFAEYSLMLARALAKRHEVLLLLSERNFKSEIGRENLISGVKGLEVICFPHRLSAGVLIANTWRIAQEVRRFAPDVIHCQEELKDYLIGALPRLPKVPFVLTVHDPKPHRGSDAKQVLFSRRRLYRHLLRRKADAVVVHGQKLRAEASVEMPWLSPNIHVIPHGPLGLLSDKAVTTDWTPGCCLFFGRIEEYKGLPLFIEAIRKLRAEGLEVRGLIAGRGDDLDRLKPGLVNDPAFEIRDRFLSPDEVVECFAQANVVVMPYREATQSGVSAYALGRGRAVVATDVGSLSETVFHGETGLLTAPEGVDSLVTAIRRIVSDQTYAKAMAVRALDVSSTTMSWDGIAEKTAAIYSGLLQRA